MKFQKQRSNGKDTNKCFMVLPTAFKPVLQQIRLLQDAWILTSDWINYAGVTSRHTGDGPVKRATCKDTKSGPTLYFSQPATTWFIAKEVWTWVVKRVTSLFNSFCSNVAKQIARLCCPVPLIKLEKSHKIKVCICHHVTRLFRKLNGTKYQHCDKWIFRSRIF